MNNLLVRRPSAKNRSNDRPGSSRRTGRQQAITYFNKAKIQQAQGKFHEALDSYIKATICDPYYFQAFCNMGVCYRSLGKYLQAKNSYLRSLKINPNDSITRYNIANLFRVIGNYQQSIKHYLLVIQYFERQNKIHENLYIHSLVNIGICYKNLGYFEQAIANYEKVNQLAPQDQGGFYNHAMSQLAFLQKTADKSITKFDLEKGAKITGLFDKVQSLNPTNKMIKLARLKLSVLLDRKKQNVEQVIQKLRQLLSTIGFQGLVNEINDLIALCMGFDENGKNLKTQKSLRSMRQIRPNTSDPPHSNKSLFKQFQDQDSNDYLDVRYLTQREGIDLIEQGQYKQLQQQLKRIKDGNPLKHTLQMVMNVEKSQNNLQFMEAAYQIYKSHFTIKNTDQCIPFDQISPEAHRVIGRILNYKRRYNESVLHLDYAAQNFKLKKNSSAFDHSSLGEAFQESGILSKAIQQYRVAFQLQPKNQMVSYNLGYCLFENDRYEEAIQYFHSYLQIGRGKSSFNFDEKALCETECYILIALSSGDMPTEFQAYRKAFDKLKSLRQNKGQVQLEQDYLMYFYNRFATLLQQNYPKISIQSKELRQVQLQLIQVYEQLLLFPTCLDRQQIIINLGKLCYECKFYIRAIDYFLEIKNSKAIPYGKMTLCYVHLIEPAMALKYMEIDIAQNQNNLHSTFNKQVIEWIYYNENGQKFNSQLPVVREDLFYQRNQYGIAIIEKLEQQLKANNVQNNEQIATIIDLILKNPSKVVFREQYKNVKFEKIGNLLSILKAKQMKNTKIIDSKILKVCFNISENIKGNFKTLLSYFNNLSNFGIQTKIIEALLYIFIYINKEKTTQINQLLVDHIKMRRIVTSVSLKILDDQINEELSILPDFKSAKDLVYLMRQWEQVLTPKIQTLLAFLEEIYYKSQIHQALQIEYHFPRHTNFLLCDQTFQKMMYIILKIIRYDKKITCKGNNILEMKKNLVSQFQTAFDNHIKTLKKQPITLSQDLVPLTVYASHKTKQQSEKFIQQILKMSSPKIQLVSAQCDQYVLVLNKLIRLRCRWNNPFELQTIVSQVIQNIVEDPLFIVNQAVVALQKLLQVIETYSEEGKKFIDQDSRLKI